MTAGGLLAPSRPDKSLLTVLYPRVGWRGPEARLRAELNRKLRVGKLHDKLPVLARDAVRSELSGLVAQVLSTRVSEVAAAGWQRSSRIQDAVSRTRARSAVTEVVMLGEHTITFTDLPCIVTRIDGVPGPQLEVALVAELHVRGIAASIRDGRLVDLRGEESDVTVALGIAGERIARRYSVLDLEAVIRDGAGGVGLHLSSAPLPTTAETVRAASAATAGLAPQHVDQLSIGSESVRLDVH